MNGIALSLTNIILVLGEVVQKSCMHPMIRMKIAGLIDEYEFAFGNQRGIR